MSCFRYLEGKCICKTYWVYILVQISVMLMEMVIVKFKLDKDSLAYYTFCKKNVELNCVHFMFIFVS